MTDDTDSGLRNQWWGARRKRYNIALILAGLGAFAAYATIASMFHDHFNQLEITVFTIVFQTIGYALAMAVANVCYFLGPVTERLIRPADVNSYRKITYRLGLLFSVLLPFLLPALLLYDVIAGA